MWPLFLLVCYCALISAASLAGGSLPLRLALTHTRLQVIMSFVGGLMLGVSLFHLLPHALEEGEAVDTVIFWMVFGLLLMFFLMRMFHFHQHEHGPTDASHSHQEHEHHCEGTEKVGPTGEVGLTEEIGDAKAVTAHSFGWFGLFFGLALHSMIDGVALAASVAVAFHAESPLGFVGAGTFFAVFLHKPLDAFSITSLMTGARWNRRWILTINAAFSLMCPLGAAAFLVGIAGVPELQGFVLPRALGFAAGVFLCISLADLLPEVQFHDHDRLKLSSSLLFGVVLAYGIGLIEPHHHHERGETANEAVHDHNSAPDAHRHTNQEQSTSP